MPAETRASWVHPLATSETGLYSVRELPRSKVQHPTMDDRYSSLEEANEQKRDFISTYYSGEGKSGLLRRYSTVEGARIYSWLLVDEGKLKYVKDSTRDGGAAATAVDSYVPKALRVGFLKDGKFIEGEPSANDSIVIVIELDIGRHYNVKFY